MKITWNKSQYDVTSTSFSTLEISLMTCRKCPHEGILKEGQLETSRHGTWNVHVCYNI
jgi:hypothetical protein